jgi:hypothetical protein
VSASSTAPPDEILRTKEKVAACGADVPKGDVPKADAPEAETGGASANATAGD